MGDKTRVSLFYLESINVEMENTVPLIRADSSRRYRLICSVNVRCNVGLWFGLDLLAMIGAAGIGIHSRRHPAIVVVPGFCRREWPPGELRYASYSPNLNSWRFIVKIIGYPVESHAHQVIFTESKESCIVFDLVSYGTLRHIIDLWK